VDKALTTVQWCRTTSLSVAVVQTITITRAAVMAVVVVPGTKVVAVVGTVEVEGAGTATVAVVVADRSFRDTNRNGLPAAIRKRTGMLSFHSWVKSSNQLPKRFECPRVLAMERLDRMLLIARPLTNGIFQWTASRLTLPKPRTESKSSLSSKAARFSSKLVVLLVGTVGAWLTCAADGVQEHLLCTR
jgi:hypothetical protein